MDAWHLLAPKFPDWTLDIIGDGEERHLLQERIDCYELVGRVELRRPTKEIGTAYSGASIMAMTSRYEGLPMVLLEAQACGLPIVAFGCKCGPRDIVTDGSDGFIVAEGDVEGLAQRLAQLMADVSLRRRMGAKAREAALRFNEDEIMKKWISTFSTLAGKRRRQ